MEAPDQPKSGEAIRRKSDARENHSCGLHRNREKPNLDSVAPCLNFDSSELHGVAAPELPHCSSVLSVSVHTHTEIWMFEIEIAPI